MQQLYSKTDRNNEREMTVTFGVDVGKGGVKAGCVCHLHLDRKGRRAWIKARDRHTATDGTQPRVKVRTIETMNENGSS